MNGMPNTLAHIGVQGLSSRLLFRESDVPWVFFGLIIPDLPWIVFRALTALTSLDPYTLRLYAIGQSSLVCCLLLSAAVALLCQRSRLIFAVLSLNSIVHLVLDASQKKLASGVHLFAPLSSKPLNFGLFWPEDWPSYVMIGAGLAYFGWTLRTPLTGSIRLRFRHGWHLTAGIALLLAYLLVPLGLQRGLWLADSHYVRTLMETTERPGRIVEFDRNAYEPREGPDVLVTFAREEIVLVGPTLERKAVVSLRGRFVDQRTIAVEHLHEHAGGLRDYASYVGLALVAWTWLRVLTARGRAGRRSAGPSEETTS